jgi:hypothetical protein
MGCNTNVIYDLSALPSRDRIQEASAEYLKFDDESAATNTHYRTFLF